MDRALLMGIVLLFLLFLLALMFVGWRARQRRQAGLGSPDTVPQDLGEIRGEFDGFYVATTVAGDPLNRIAVRGLGYRSRAHLTVADAGLVLALRGENEVFIPVSALREVTTATWTIDRVVEQGGLVLVGWNLASTPSGGTPAPAGTAPTTAAPTTAAPTTAAPTPTAHTAVDSYFRLEEAPQLLDALNLIFTAPTGRKA